MDIGRLGLAFTAGIFAFLSPCALPLLPSYIVYYLNQRSKVNLSQVILFAFMTLIGFLSVYTIIGIFPSVAIRFLPINSKIIQPIIGTILILIGLIYGFTNFFNHIPLFNLKPLKSSNPFSYLVYGVGYAFASMSCSLPIFMLLIGQSITVKLFENITLYFFYGLGVSSILFPLTIMLYFSQDHLFNKIIESLPYIKKISSFILIISGLFMLYLSINIYFY